MLADLGRYHGVSFLALRSDESSASTLLENLCIIGINDCQGITRHISVALSLIVAEELVLLTEVQFLHLGNEHLGDLLSLDLIVDGGIWEHDGLVDWAILEIDAIAHFLPQLFKLGVSRDLSALDGDKEGQESAAIRILLL